MFDLKKTLTLEDKNKSRDWDTKNKTCQASKQSKLREKWFKMDLNMWNVEMPKCYLPGNMVTDSEHA